MKNEQFANRVHSMWVGLLQSHYFNTNLLRARAHTHTSRVHNEQCSKQQQQQQRTNKHISWRIVLAVTMWYVCCRRPCYYFIAISRNLFSLVIYFFLYFCISHYGITTINWRNMSKCSIRFLFYLDYWRSASNWNGSQLWKVKDPKMKMLLLKIAFNARQNTFLVNDLT